MQNLIQSNSVSTGIWLVLAVLTLLTFSIGEAGMAGRQVMLGLLFIALVKGQMVANYFMGLRQAGFWWRALVLFYFLIVGGLIALAYLMGLD
ncbi:MAG: cytochrome C oxidase subunit IV family protein [Methylophilaceae bacterium]|jgi:cytochrome c oxidase subunit 4|nr:cytochrome C oxidase subunit IV family protein [Methylophilaceae bacterium]